MFVVWVEREYRNDFTAVDRIRTGHFIKSFVSGGLLYVYKNQFEVFTIDTDMILEIDGKPGEYRKRHGSYTEITDNFSVR